MAASQSSGIGAKRLVVGAHYGVGSFLLQRLTAVILTVFVLLLIVRVSMGDSGYEGWFALFAPLWFKLLTLVALFALAYHAWVGMRDIWMDYVKPTWVRLTLQTLTVLWLAGCALWAVEILWKV